MYGLDEKSNMKRITNPPIIEEFKVSVKGYSSLTIGIAILIILVIVYLLYKYTKSE